MTEKTTDVGHRFDILLSRVTGLKLLKQGGLARISAAAVCVLGLRALCADFATGYAYTETPRYEGAAWMSGAERFPDGAAIRKAIRGRLNAIATGFYATADPAISYDARMVLFAGKQSRQDPWQIWETALAGGNPRKLVSLPDDCIRPLYLPDKKIVYARRTAAEYQLEVASLAGGKSDRITYAAGNVLPDEVLADGRIVFETSHPGISGPVRELYTVYSDGSGVEAYRCDHGRDRHDARQITSRDLIFVSGTGLAKFTPALAHGVDLAAPPNDFSGGLAEGSGGVWLVSARRSGAARFSLFEWLPGATSMRAIPGTAGRDRVQPAVIAKKEIPLRHSSGLHDRDNANLLCLNVYTAQKRIPAGDAATVRLYGRDGEADEVLGETAVESDGSFFLQVPTERPLRLELLDAMGGLLQGERSWFWMRRGEQRVCVGCHAGPERAPENRIPKVLLRADVPVRMTTPQSITANTGGR
jgi:hypothetical protein